jgi:fido (protein-threonine AMPylation protein)
MGVQVLRNKLDLHSFSEWFDAERTLTAGRQLEQIARPDLVERTFDVEHWQAIHH